jgi:hypothetical protein
MRKNPAINIKKEARFAFKDLASEESEKVISN